MTSNKKSLKNKGVALVLTAFVIALLIVAGPVQGFTLGIGMDDNRVDKGDEVVFNLEIILSISPKSSSSPSSTKKL